MNEEMVRLWNETVGPDDTVYHLGDFAPFKKHIYITDIVSRLNGKIILIQGNHDKEIGDPEKFRSFGFKEVYNVPIVINGFIILSHEPLYIPNGDTSPYRWIFGHVHGDPSIKTISDMSACACVERWGYKPVELSKIMKEWETLAAK